MINVAIAGGAGYTAGELIRLLVNHPEVELKYIQSESHAGAPIHSVHKDLLYSLLEFGPIDFSDIDVLFLCMGHGYSKAFLDGVTLAQGTKVIDLGNDFRLKADAGNFVYGLPELSRDDIYQANYIANPGCFATAIELGLLPLAQQQQLPNYITVMGVTGSTGAGQKLSQECHYSNRSSNLSNYKVFTHQHLGEISETLEKAGNWNGDIAFVPMRGAHTRGILVNSVIRSTKTADEVYVDYAKFYQDHPFVVVSKEPVSLKQVVNTNYCYIQITSEAGKVLITTVLDNLLKGASGQAVQNMNIMFGLDEQAGLRLKANYF